MNHSLLRATLEQVESSIEKAVTGPPLELNITETGTITHTGGGIARFRGLHSVRAEELLLFPGGVAGIALDLGPDETGAILLGDAPELVAGAPVQGTGRIADTPVGKSLLGRVVDVTGRVLDGGAPLQFHERYPMEREAPAIMDRAPVKVPLQTGIKAIDALIPIGRGQRELILGDRQTGKTSVALDTIINQRDNDVVCIYCAIGQRATAVARVVETLRDHDLMDQTIVVVASGEDPPGLQFLTPYGATSMAEWFMEQGRDVLIVYDDLTRHARAYRELSLLLRRPPGREAFPGDIFYIHSRLLERATHLNQELGGGSLTALPILETEAEDISAYIPTNLVSITDGQIYLSPILFRKGELPAVDTGKSVSRVGGKTQLPAYRELAGDLRLAYSQFKELETFARFATRLDKETRATITRGRCVREVLKQQEHAPLSVTMQIAILKAVTDGLLDDLPLDQFRAIEQHIRKDITGKLEEIDRHIQAGEPLSETDWDRFGEVLVAAIEGYQEDNGND
ncbi:MAG: alternate F1F0 ATPase, F1 subunit alpha [Thermodesulfobacteriota bacterium]|nr:alternate F1F0 ATPase, F1 subunit alpha [Thermodesulfobacteriota bacterium]